VSATWCRYLRRTAAGRRCGFAACWVTGPPDHLGELDGPRAAPAVHGRIRDAGDPARWRQGLDNLLGGWLTGASEEVAGWTRRETGSYGFDMWSRAARAVTADYGQYGSPLRAAMELDHQPDLLHPYSQPRTAAFLAGQQDFSAANPWFSARQLDGVTHFPALEIPDATAAEIERFLG
jgi:hypothetical protein